ncbi:MAG TPA: hypothetical protein ENH85_12935 [Candidatus Scalindua sp.]|nr:hypothetical protein [Candidatus Scalindua sp.]
MKKDFFKTWSPNMAWMLGYIWADGSVHVGTSHGCAVSFECTVMDKELLVHVRRILESHHKLAFVSRIRSRDSCLLRVSGKKLVMDLVELHGIKPGKSRLDEPFPEVPDKYVSHFIRGYLDGDGFVSVQKCESGKICIHVAFCGRFNFLEGLRCRLINLLNLRNHQVRVSGRGYVVEWAWREDVKRLYHWLYPADDVPNLKRKRLKMLKVFDCCDKIL